MVFLSIHREKRQYRRRRIVRDDKRRTMDSARDNGGRARARFGEYRTRRRKWIISRFCPPSFVNDARAEFHFYRDLNPPDPSPSGRCIMNTLSRGIHGAIVTRTTRFSSRATRERERGFTDVIASSRFSRSRRSSANVLSHVSTVNRGQRGSPTLVAAGATSGSDASTLNHWSRRCRVLEEEGFSHPARSRRFYCATLQCRSHCRARATHVRRICSARRRLIVRDAPLLDVAGACYHRQR